MIHKLIVVLCLLLSNLANASAAGFQLETFNDANRNRPIAIDWWYPVENQSAEFFDYGFGQGHVVEAGRLAPGAYPLIVLSHGAMGAARNYSWLAESLARNGYIVAGISHFGESYVHGSETVDPSAVLRSWERPLDISAAITYILGPSQFAQMIDWQRIGFVGHSSGGATAVSLAGVLFDGNKIAHYCGTDQALDDRGCDYARHARHKKTGAKSRLIGQATQVLTKTNASAGAELQSYADPRIQVLIALDPALGPGFSDYSEVDPSLSLLVVGSVENDFLPFKHHAEDIAAKLPSAKTHWLHQGAGHFVYLNECDLNLKANGVPLCADKTGVSRAAIHVELKDLILNFLNESFSSEP